VTWPAPDKATVVDLDSDVFRDRVAVVLAASPSTELWRLFIAEADDVLDMPEMVAIKKVLHLLAASNSITNKTPGQTLLDLVDVPDSVRQWVLEMPSGELP
jgi:hypothetical protein